MAEFHKSLIRFMYVALAVVVVLGVWGIVMRPGPEKAGGTLDGYAGRRGVTATGTCIVRTKPEVVEVTLGVRQSAKTARGAKDYVKSTCRKIVKALSQGGVARKDMQTQNFHLALEWDYGHNWQVKKWNADEAVRVRIRQIDKVADLIDAAVKAGANRVGGLSYTVDNLNEIRAKGRAKAAAVARKKAQELASALGGKLGKLVSCDEQYPGSYDYGYYSYYDGYGANRSLAAQANVAMESPQPDLAGAEELTIQPGEMVTKVLVTATYELE